MIQITKKPKFLSPSSLNEAEGNPNKFVLRRMVDDPRPRDPQSMPAAAGSSFDHFVKKYISEKNNFDLKEKLLRGMFTEYVDGVAIDPRVKYKDYTGDKLMFETNVEPQNREEAYKAGLYLFSKYIEAGLLKDCCNYRDIEIRRNFVLLQTGVPLYGILDAEWTDAGSGDSKAGSGSATAIPYDWKVSGYGSDSGVSPKKYYMQSWQDGVPLGAHKEYREDIPFHEIDSDWAVQGCTYGWMMGLPPLKPFNFMVDMIAIRPLSVKIARYKGVITPEFQTIVMGRYTKIWHEVQSGAILNRCAPERLMAEVQANNERWWM
jgi:hypothetical protein